MKGFAPMRRSRSSAERKLRGGLVEAAEQRRQPPELASDASPIDDRGPRHHMVAGEVLQLVVDELRRRPVLEDLAETRERRHGGGPGDVATPGVQTRADGTLECVPGASRGAGERFDPREVQLQCRQRIALGRAAQLRQHLGGAPLVHAERLGLDHVPQPSEILLQGLADGEGGARSPLRRRRSSRP